MQGAGGTVFFVHFLLMGAYGGAFFNLVNLFRALLFAKNDKKAWKLAVTIAAYTAAFGFSVYTLWGDLFNIALVALPFVGLIVMSVLMWQGDGVKIRYGQIACVSPTWIVHNIFNFSLGGLVCEVFNIISSLIAIVRFKREAK